MDCSSAGCDMAPRDTFNQKPLILLLLLLNTVLTSCSSRDCYQLPDRFESYEEAKVIISNTHFLFEESVWTLKSSWIDRASYHSCDGRTGFFIIHTGGKTYVHDRVPIGIWYGFKKADSYGRFYNRNLRGKFRLRVTKTR